MTVFGRDTIITCLQTMLLGPELALAALDALAELQAREDDPSIDAEPGKIIHELRRGRAAETWFATYYGTRRRDAALPHPALGGLALDRRRRAVRAAAGRRARGARAGSTATATATATASSSTSAARERGLENQSWKDSGDSQRFHDGTFALDADRAGRGAGLRLRREAAARRAGARGLARRAARASGSSARRRELRAPLRRGVLGRGARRLLRARARRRQAPGRLALLEHRAPALERDRAAGARRGDRRPR